MSLKMADKVADQKVSDALKAEIDSIKVDGGKGTEVSYEPRAWTREGRTD